MVQPLDEGEFVMITGFTQTSVSLNPGSNVKRGFTIDRILPFANGGGVQITVFTVLLLLGITFLTTPSAAQSEIMPRSELVKLLGEQYAETPVAAGLSDSGTMIEVFAALDGSTWTMIMTTPDGVSRVIQAGEAWIGIIPRPAHQASLTGL